jgi:hypothetical protein
VTTTGEKAPEAPNEPPPQPVPDPDSAGFWEATSRGELAIRRCEQCRLWCHLPLERCRRCGAPTRYEPVSGEGALYSFIVVHQPAVPGYRDHPPYVIGAVDLAEQPGLRLVTRLEDAVPDELWAGQPMRARIVDHPGDGYRIPVFAPVAAGPPAQEEARSAGSAGDQTGGAPAR